MVSRSHAPAAALPARIMAAEWPDLNEAEQRQAVEIAQREGHRAAHRMFAEPADGRPGPVTLRASRWAREQGMHRTDDAALLEFAAAYTVPVEHDYVDHVIDRCCPERAWWWGGSEPEELRQDPRVCAFCDGYERQRRAILRMQPLPTGLADLQLYLWQMKEQERDSARAWYDSETQSYSTPEYAARQRSFTRYRYRQHQFDTDLAEMLLEAAAFRGPVVRRTVSNTKTRRREAAIHRDGQDGQD